MKKIKLKPNNGKTKLFKAYQVSSDEVKIINFVGYATIEDAIKNAEEIKENIEEEKGEEDE